MVAKGTKIKKSSFASSKTKSTKSKISSARAVQPIANGERAWKVARLAATLATAQIVQRSSDQQNHSFPSKNFDRFCVEVLWKAKKILDGAEGRLGEIHAYQLFEEGKIYTEEKILNVFFAAGWQGLSSKRPIINLMADIRSKFEDELSGGEIVSNLYSASGLLPALLKDLHSQIDSVRSKWVSDEFVTEAHSNAVKGKAFEILKQKAIDYEAKFPKNFSTTIEKLAGIVVESIAPTISNEIQTAFTQFIGELKTSLEETVPEIFREGGSVERFYNDMEARMFFTWCFPEPPESSRAKRTYRPYEIFLRCAERRWKSNILVQDSDVSDLRVMPAPSADVSKQKYSIFRRHLEGALT